MTADLSSALWRQEAKELRAHLGNDVRGALLAGRCPTAQIANSTAEFDSGPRWED